MDENKLTDLVPELEDAVSAEEQQTEETAVEEVAVEETAAASADSKAEGSLKKVVILMAIVAVLLLGVLASGLLDDRSYTPIAYIKGNALFVSDVKNEPYQAAENVSVGGQVGYEYLALGVDVAEDNKVMTYQSNVAEDGTYFLYYRDTAAGSGEGVLVAEGVLYHEISKNGKSVAYIVAEDAANYVGNLYCFDGKESHKVAEGISAVANGYGVSNFRLSDDGKNLIYVVDNGNGENYSLYHYTADKNTTQLISEEALNYILYQDNGVAYLHWRTAEKTEFTLWNYHYTNGATMIEECAYGVMTDSTEPMTLLYTVDTNQVVAYADMVIDDCAEMDALITMPNVEEYTEEESDALMNAYYDYQYKLMRDSIRSQLADAGSVTVTQTLYAFRNGEKIMLAENVIGCSDLDHGIVYLTGDADKAEKVNLSEVTSLDQLVSAYYGNVRRTGEIIYLNDSSKESHRFQEVGLTLQSVMDAPDGNALIYNTALEVGTIVSRYAVLENGMYVPKAELDANASSVTFSNTGHAAAYVDSVGTLWYVKEDGSKAELAPYCLNYYFMPDNTNLHFLATEEGTDGALFFYDGSAVEKLDSDVYFAYGYDHNVIGYIKNYDRETKAADLYFIKNGKSQLVDTGVSHMYLYF